MIREISIDLNYQPEIPEAPVPDLYQRACSGDGVTITHWRETWLKNYQATKDHFGTLTENTVGQLYGANRGKAAIVIGSGPSLKESLEELKRNQESEHPLLTISCMHNKGLFNDEGIKPDYYITLDAGEIIFKDVYEGRKEPEEHYWDLSKDETVLAHVCTPTKFWDKWKGKAYLFNSIVPDRGIMDAYNKIERMSHNFSCGGNAAGAAMYAARVLMCSPTIIYVGMDFCFSYDNHWHSYPTETYDKVGQYVIHPDVFGIPRKTWNSYVNFKFFFDHIAKTVPGIWINASEGLLGAYLGGNLKHYKYMTLKEAITMHKMADTLYLQTMKDGKEVEKTPFEMGELWKNPQHEMDLVAF